MKLPRFRSKLLYWLIGLVVIAMLCAFWAPQIRQQQRVAKDKQWYLDMEAHGAELTNFSPPGGQAVTTVSFKDCAKFSGDSAKLLATSLRQIVAVAIVPCSRANDETLAPLGTLKSLRWLALDSTQVGTDGLPFCADLVNLERIDLRNTLIDGRAIEVLAKLPKLQAIYLSGTQITDQDIVPLKAHPSLAYIDLRRTLVTKEGAKILRTIPNRERTWIGD